MTDIAKFCEEHLLQHPRLKQYLPQKFEKASLQTELSSELLQQLEELKSLGGVVLVFNNGVFDPQRSHRLNQLDQIDQLEQEKGLHLQLPAGEKLPLIVIAHLSGKEGISKWAFPHLKIHAQSSCRASLLECYLNDGKACVHLGGRTEIILDEGSQVEYVKVLVGGGPALHIGHVQATVNSNANLNLLTFVLDTLSQNNLLVNLDGENAKAQVHGLLDLSGERYSGNNSLIRHNCAKTSGEQLFKALVGDTARAAFCGKMFVARDAQEVKSWQLSKNLLLGPKAHIDTRPELEVYADNVQCNHGATVGQLSEEEIFYLQGRGIPYKDALALLCYAFANQILEFIEHPALKEWGIGTFKKRFKKHIEQIA